MPDKSLKDIPPNLRELYKKGNDALQRNNLDYAIAIYHQVLQQEPAFLDCRQALRAAQIKKAGGGGGFLKKMFGGASASPLLAKAQMTSRKNPLEAIQTVEQILNSDPDNSAALKILADAALAADLPRTAVFTLERLVKLSPGDRDLNVRLAKALAASGQVSRAEGVYEELLRAEPNDADIFQALKDLSARKTLDEGGYDALADGTGSYRDILKDKEEAVALEQEKREVKTDDVAGRLIRDYEARLATEPKNIKLLRNTAELYAQRKEFDKALQYCETLKATEIGADPSLDRLITDITLKKLDHALTQLDLNAPDYTERSAKLQAERDAYQLSECEKRAERYPSDLQIRFELGELYFKTGKIGEAIQEFQKTQNNPHLRIQTLSYLGQCFARRGMNDLAARTLLNALKEKVGFDDEKKELYYALGCVYEKMNRPDDAVEQFKHIYEVDIGYKDVAAKVDAYYAAKQ